MALRSMRPSSAIACAGISYLLSPAAASIATPPSAFQSFAPPFTCRSTPLVYSTSLQQQSAAYSTSATPPPAGSVAYRLAVSYCGKGRKVNPARDVTPLDLALLRSRGQYAIAGAPPRSGQDAFFMGSLGDSRSAEDSDDGDVVFGVADGVGGWVDSGIDPSAFSEGLCRYMAEHASIWDEKIDGRLTPLALMQAGYEGTKLDEEIEGGGSTAVAAIGRTNGLLEVANLGDSGFVHYRPNATSFVSPAQVHAFNTPYQLSIIPAHIQERSRNFGGEPLHDYPSDSAVTQHIVSHGDVIVFGTDGVWDNLNSGDVLDIVRKEMNAAGGWVVRGDKNGKGEAVGATDLERLTDWHQNGAAQSSGSSVGNASRSSFDEDTAQLISIQEKLAYKITKHAQLAAVDMKRVSPFGRELRRWYPNEEWRGGKVDDIAVVVAVIVAK